MTNNRRFPALFVAAAAAFAAYPALRPWGDKAGAAVAGDPLAIAHAFADIRWPIAHALGMAGFVLLAVALRLLARAGERAQNWRKAENRAWFAVALLLPYYGAEAFALHALGAHVIRTGDLTALAVADGFRFATLPMATFGLGLVALALVGGRLWHEFWRSGPTGRLGGVLAGIGLITYLPQFYLPPVGRVAHGITLAAGLVLLAGVTRAPGDGDLGEGPPRR